MMQVVDVDMFFLCANFRHPTHCKLTFDLLNLKAATESSVTWNTAVLMLVFPGLSVHDFDPMTPRDTQIDVRRT